MTLHLTRIPSPVGEITLVGGDAGLRAVLFARETAPADAVEGPHPVLDEAARQLAGWFAGERTAFDLPLDLDSATAFQRRVWEELKAIPRGQTRSYGEIARRIGQPTAARAVARACATNPVAVVIPCHRVVARGGGISGYRWGVERKRRLLEREAAASPARGGHRSSRR